MKHKVHMMAAALLVLLFVAGCGDSSSESDNNENEGTKDQAAEAEDNDEKDLTPEEIIVKSNETMNDWPGMRYSISGTQDIHAEQGDNEEDITQDIDMDAKMTLDPMAMAIQGNITMQDEEIPANTYYKDETMYSESPGEGWIAIEGMDLEAMQENSQTPNPTEQMEDFINMMDELSDGDDEANQYISKEDEDDSYVITLTLDEQGLSKVQDKAEDLIEQSMGEQMQELTGDAMEQMTYENMEITFHIDKDTFEQEKMEQQMTISMEQEGVSVTLDSDMDIDMKGKFTEEITIPDDVKENAQQIDLEQLQQTAQEEAQEQ